MNIRPVVLARYQQGIVLLILFMIVFMIGAGLFITLLNNNVVGQRRDSNTMDALRAAKDVLIAYAVSQGDYYGANGAGPGHLICPDIDGDGIEDSPCAANSLGRLPVSITLPSGAIFPVSDYNDGIDQQFWYALSDVFRRNPAGIVNTAAVGNLTIDGQGGIAAALISPEQLITPQTRPSNAAADYLEANNTAGPDFVTNDPLAPNNFNDRVLVITFNEILSPVSARVAEAIKAQIDGFHVLRGNYPRTQNQFNNAMTGIGGGGGGGRGGRGGGGGGGLAAMPAWFINNNWIPVSNYNQINDDSASVIFTGCNITYTFTFGVTSIAKTGSLC